MPSERLCSGNLAWLWGHKQIKWGNLEKSYRILKETLLPTSLCKTDQNKESGKAGERSDVFFECGSQGRRLTRWGLWGGFKDKCFGRLSSEIVSKECVGFGQWHNSANSQCVGVTVILSHKGNRWYVHRCCVNPAVAKDVKCFPSRLMRELVSLPFPGKLWT